MTVVLARRYRALLLAYPPAWRAARGDELLGTLLDAAAPGQRRPALREAVSLVVQGLRARAGRTTGQVWGQGLRIGVLVLLATAYTGVVADLVTGPVGGPPEGPGPLVERVRLAAGLAALVVGVTAMIALTRGRTAAATCLTVLWLLLPAQETLQMELAAAALLLPFSRGARLGAAWLLTLPALTCLQAGVFLASGVFEEAPVDLLVIGGLLLSVTYGVVLDPRAPIAVACLGVAVTLGLTLHAPAVWGSSLETPIVAADPGLLVVGGVVVLLGALGHVRAARFARL